MRIFVRPLGSSLPLGFFSFGIGMALLGGGPLGWIPPQDQHSVAILLAAFVFPLELLAAIVAFLARDTFGATGLGLFTTSWLALGLVLLASPSGVRSPAVGLYLIAFCAAVLLLAAAAVISREAGVRQQL